MIQGTNDYRHHWCAGRRGQSTSVNPVRTTAASGVDAGPVWATSPRTKVVHKNVMVETEVLGTSVEIDNNNEVVDSSVVENEVVGTSVVEDAVVGTFVVRTRWWIRLR